MTAAAETGNTSCLESMAENDEKAIQTTDRDIQPNLTEESLEDNNEPMNFRPWQQLPVFFAMGLGIFILGLASISVAVCSISADPQGYRTIPSWVQQLPP